MESSEMMNPLFWFDEKKSGESASLGHLPNWYQRIFAFECSSDAITSASAIMTRVQTLHQFYVVPLFICCLESAWKRWNTGV